MTLVFILDGSVNLDRAFSLLPITRIEFTPPKRQKKKFELPHCSIPGAILSMRHAGDIRGIIRSASKEYFKNSVTIDLSTITKNVSIKLSKNRIQMCGASSEEQGREGAQYLIDHLSSIQDSLDYIKLHPEAAAATILWLAERTKGEKTLRPVSEGPSEEDHFIISVTDMSGCPDRTIFELLYRQHQEFDFHSFFVSEMEWIIGLEELIQRPFRINKIYKAMVNYNYNLGFTVDRYALYENILDKCGFISSYDNCVEHCVKIKLPYIPDDDIIRRKKKTPCHCFLVYQSGVTTQTGPGGEKMEEAYNRFWRCILEIKDKIAIKIRTPPPARKVIIKRSYGQSKGEQSQ